MACAGDIPTPPRTAIWSDAEAKWIRIRRVLSVDMQSSRFAPGLELIVVDTESMLPVGVPLKFRFEIQMNDERSLFRGIEAVAVIREANPQMMGGGCGTSQFQVVRYHLNATEQIVDNVSGPSQIADERHKFPGSYDPAHTPGADCREAGRGPNDIPNSRVDMG